MTEDDRYLGALVAADPVVTLWVRQDGEHAELELALPLTAEFTIGREADVIILRPTVSREHVIASRLGQGLRLRLPARRPKNGIQVRGVRIADEGVAVVDPGETWRIGSTVVVALTEAQARARRVLSSLLGADATTWVVDAAARGCSFGITGLDAAARRSVALAVADVSPRRSARRGEICPGGTHTPRNREDVRQFAEAVASGLAYIEQDAVTALRLSSDDRGALERYVTDGVRSIQLLWSAETEAEVRGRLGIVADRLEWIAVPRLRARARVGAIPALLAQALEARRSPLTVADLLEGTDFQLDTLAGYDWPDGLAELDVFVTYLLDQHAGTATQETARKVGLSRHALRRLVQAWTGGEGPRRRGLLDRMRRR